VSGEGTGDRVHELISPATGDHIANVPLASTADIERAVTAAREAQDEVRHWSAFERADMLHRIAEAVSEMVDDIARIQTLEQG
jgi:succinate-semialdehyde dehydrogenase/glutarate-semialdehyde dehydrogenase